MSDSDSASDNTGGTSTNKLVYIVMHYMDNKDKPGPMSPAGYNVSRPVWVTNVEKTALKFAKNYTKSTTLQLGVADEDLRKGESFDYKGTKLGYGYEFPIRERVTIPGARGHVVGRELIWVEATTMEETTMAEE